MQVFEHDQRVLVQAGNFGFVFNTCGAVALVEALTRGKNSVLKIKRYIIEKNEVNWTFHNQLDLGLEGVVLVECERRFAQNGNIHVAGDVGAPLGK